jgi:hypothetical protein
MSSKLLVLACLASSFGLMTAVVAAQQVGQEQPELEQQQPQAAHDVAVVFLDEVDGSGFEGFAVMRGQRNDDEQQAGQQQTDIIVAIRNGNGEGFLGLGGGADEQDLNSAAILTGDCEMPELVVHELGQLRPLGQAAQQHEEGQGTDGTASGYVVAVHAPMALDELLTSGYVIGVLEADDQTGQLSLPYQVVEELNFLACAEITEGARVQVTAQTP